MSFIYPASLAPPAPGRYRLPITTGSRFEIYEIEVSDEERIETPLGTLQDAAGEAAAAPRRGEHRNLARRRLPLPAREASATSTARAILSGEQVVSEIRMSED